MLKAEITEELQRMVGYGTFERTMDVLAQAVTCQPFVAGPSFSAADVYVGSHVMWGMQFGTLPKRPEFEAYAAKLSSRPAYVAAKAIDDELGKELAARQGKG
jgi:glutathione S-transferase